MKADKELKEAIWILLIMTILFGLYTTQIASADIIPSDRTTIPTSGAAGGEEQLNLPVTIGEELPKDKNTKAIPNRGTSSIPDQERVCATVEGELRCAPKIIEEPK